MATSATRLGAAVVAISIVLGAAGARLVSEGRTELAASDVAWQHGDAVDAAVHARGAARAYVPGAGHMHLGYARLREIAETSERKGDVSSALFAWRAMLSAAAASRPVSVAGDDVRVEAERAVARLSATLVASSRSHSGTHRAPSPEGTVHANALPGAGWGALLVGGAALWCGAGIRLAARGWRRDGRVVPAEFRLAAVMALLGLAAWVAGLLLG